MASVRIVKSKMNVLGTNISNTSNSLNNLITLLQGITESTSRLISSPTDKLISDLKTFREGLRGLYNITRVELDVFFQDYNSTCNKVLNMIEPLIVDLQKLKLTSKTLYLLYLIDIAMGGFLKYNLSEEDLKKHIPMIRRFLNEIKILKEKTIYNNNKLIIKNNRG